MKKAEYYVLCEVNTSRKSFVADLRSSVTKFSLESGMMRLNHFPRLLLAESVDE